MKLFIEVANGQLILSSEDGGSVHFPFTGEESPKREITVSEYREQMNNCVRRISGPEGGCYDVETQQSFVYGFIAGLKAAGKFV